MLITQFSKPLTAALFTLAKLFYLSWPVESSSFLHLTLHNSIALI
ncbi:hypothetical protein DB42_AC00390 [Neochlamydia sp. EPS4]|nr:hypothetical protein DB42_AC00390 [Neochlamydia sp. EPS4]